MKEEHIYESTLTVISSFASSTFLLIFTAINLSAIRLRNRIGTNVVITLAGLLVSLASWIVLFVYLYRTNLRGLVWIGAFYLIIIVAELSFSKRRLFFKR